MKKNIEIELSEEDWAFVTAEVERLKREECAEVSEADVVSTLVETGIGREMEHRRELAAEGPAALCGLKP